jgi:electron transfer flavoprotein beta subunit
MAKFEVTPKVVLGVQSARQTPRYAPVSRVRQIMKESGGLDEKESDASNDDGGAVVRRMYLPEKGKGAQMIEGDADEVAAKIAELLNAKRS